MVTVSDRTPHSLIAAVQYNCDISDALYARDYSMCIYLLKMREYFRWEKGYGYGDSLPKEELGDWLTAREARWETIQEQPFRPIEWDGQELDPFDNDAVNAAIHTLGLVYSGGLGNFAKPHFFLAELEREERHEGRSILVAGRELARDITAPPAMTRDHTVFIRRESLRRTVWEKVEEWQWRKRADHPMARAVVGYDFTGDLDGALDRMTDDQVEAVVLHELGELEAGHRLGPEWEPMLMRMIRTPTEFLARAVRDHLADALVTLPALLEREAWAALHFYFGNFTGMRREIYPALYRAYVEWQEHGRLDRLAQTVEQGRGHWLAIGKELLARYRQETGAAELRPADIAR